MIRIDEIDDNGNHIYWSTHCRHDRHEACDATELAPGIPRTPARCKTCSAPCTCSCHLAVSDPAGEAPDEPEGPRSVFQVVMLGVLRPQFERWLDLHKLVMALIPDSSPDDLPTYIVALAPDHPLYPARATDD